MPLSKKRDRMRKRKSNLSGLESKPKRYIVRPAMVMEGSAYMKSTTTIGPPELDASGEVVPEYW